MSQHGHYIQPPQYPVPPAQQPRKRRTVWPWLLDGGLAALTLVGIGTAAIVAGLTGVTVDTAQTQSTLLSTDPTATVTDTAENDRWACHEVTKDDGPFGPDVNLAIASVAVKSTNPGIRAAGERLSQVALENQELFESMGRKTHGFSDQFDVIHANLAMGEARLNLAEACADLFGDGSF